MTCRIQGCAQTHCHVCRRTHLRPVDGGKACVWCVGRVRADLATIVDLTTHAQTRIDGWPPTSPGTARTGPRATEPPLPGGQLLVMLAGGSDGRSETHETWRADDPVPVVWLLCQWEDAFRHELGLRAGEASSATALPTAAKFLGDNLDWAAAHFSDFAPFADELAKVRAALEAQLRTGPQRSPVPCTTCGRRALEPVDPRHHPDPEVAYRCGHCRQTYTPKEFWKAVYHHEANTTDEAAGP